MPDEMLSIPSTEELSGRQIVGVPAQGLSGDVD